MSNSQSPQSKATRKNTAAEWNKKNRKNGNVKQFNVTLIDTLAIEAVAELPNKAQFLTNVLSLYKNGLISNEGKII
ncbi:MAG TPA: hypothetical protein VN698_12570 [Bacteroidia bacterium]|nr:hypothetical protein [Bacteroidia bacterium]